MCITCQSRTELPGKHLIPCCLWPSYSNSILKEFNWIVVGKTTTGINCCAKLHQKRWDCSRVCEFKYKLRQMSLMAKWLNQASQWHEMYCHDLEVMSSNPVWIELGMHITSVLSHTWTKSKLSYSGMTTIIQMYIYFLLHSIYRPTLFIVWSCLRQLRAEHSVHVYMT